MSLREQCSAPLGLERGDDATRTTHPCVWRGGAGEVKRSRVGAVRCRPAGGPSTRTAGRGLVAPGRHGGEQTASPACRQRGETVDGGLFCPHSFGWEKTCDVLV